MQKSTGKDAAGYRCGDWYGYNCYVSPGYSEDNLAKVRDMCPACCAVSSVPPTDDSMQFDKMSGKNSDSMDNLTALANALASQNASQNANQNMSDSDPGVVIIVGGDPTGANGTLSASNSSPVNGNDEILQRVLADIANSAGPTFLSSSDMEPDGDDTASSDQDVKDTASSDQDVKDAKKKKRRLAKKK
jgi:hypothetical protein